MSFEDTLYPLQDKVLDAADGAGTDFYLTGGTALSRCYFHHRYSDDLDFFVNREKRFMEMVTAVLTGLSSFRFERTVNAPDIVSVLIEKRLRST